MSEKNSLNFLYNTALGRLFLKLLTRPFISEICGKFLDSRLSVKLISSFIKKNDIDMAEYIEQDYKSFNEFFCRQVKPELRPIDNTANHLIAPCDGLLSTYKINDTTVMPIKQSEYTIAELLQDNELAEEFKNGTCLVFRLCVNNYHRYCYIDNGTKSNNVHIKGILHTVRPIALHNTPVFKQNTREYTIIETENFGKVVQMEIGALLVGKIKNLHRNVEIKRGQEKGYFLYGGSTVIVLLTDKYKGIPQTEELPVKMGQCIAASEDSAEMTEFTGETL